MFSDGFAFRGVAGVLTVFFLFSSCVSAEKKCPTNDDVVPLDLTKAIGEWWLVAGTPTSGTTISKCGHITLENNAPNTLFLNYTSISRRSHAPVTFTAHITVGDDNIGKWQLQGSKRFLGPFKHRLLAAAYDSYLVFVVCGENNPDLPLHKFALIMGRDRIFAPSTLVHLKEKLHPYFDSDAILDVDHNTCDTLLPLLNHN